MTANLEALLAAVYANPDDDAARLVYADALQDVGDPRGELIALQVRGIGGARVRELIKHHGDVWLGELAQVVISTSWERGFPESMVLDVYKSESIRRLARHREWSTIRTIQLGGSQRMEVPGFPRSYETHCKAIIRALAKAPGADGRVFRPSLDEIDRAIRRRKAPR